MRVEYINFRDRAERAEYVANRFKRFLSGRIIDVGCDHATLKKLLSNIDYVGVDVGGDPDIQLNLEEIHYLPFNDRVFDCVVCTDVLEHLNNLHHIFGELIRVAKRYMVLSLPNNWVNARGPIGRGKGSFGHYGLPADPPRDRHKWFFSMSEAIDFIKSQEKKYPISILELFAMEKPRNVFVRWLRRMLYPSQKCYLNRYAHTIWIVIEKRGRGSESESR
jgi:SAM-dependent methyltransferase